MIEIIGGRLTQWDHARMVQVTNSEATHVHFANPGDVTAVIMKLEDGKALVPDYLLHTGKAVLAYAVLNGVTLEIKSFPVRKREKPEGYVYEEDTRNYIYAVIAEAEKATEAANKAADAAHQAVQETLDVNVTNESVTKALGYTPASQNDLEVERTRINTFTSLPEGSTAGDAELADARIDKDGKTHANVGEHIRSVSSNLSEQIGDISKISYNLLPKGESVGYSLNGVTASYSDGILSLVGVSTGRITRTNKIVEFSLPQGTYTIFALGLPITDKLKGVYLVNKSTGNNITITYENQKTFTLENDTDCYLSIDCYESCAFGDTKAHIQINTGENALPFQYPSYATANDKVAREKIEELDERYPVIEDTPLSKINSAPTFITMFKRIMHIGDSLTLGVFNTTNPNTDGAYIDGYNRPAMMERMCGNENVNLGFSGATVSEENNSNWWRFLNLSETKLTKWNETGDCYIIALGTNDIIKIGSFTGSTDTDINLSDYTQNAMTSVGSYAKIIQMIQEKTPKAKIFCVTIPQSRNTTSTRSVANAKIKAIASLFNCYVIDLETYAEQEGDEFSSIYKNSSHNNVLGYNLRARQYIAYIDWIISHNLDDFRNVQFIGTDYDYVD